MKIKLYISLVLIGTVLLALPAVVGAQVYYEYLVSNNVVTLFNAFNTNALVIPSTLDGVQIGSTTLNGVPVGGIGPWGFSHNQSLTSVTITNDGINIGDSAFTQCPNLTNVVLGSAITNIGYNAFSRCPSLSQITVDPLNPAFTAVNGILFDKTQTTLIRCPINLTGSYVISASVTNIAPSAFSQCCYLTNITIPNSVVVIGRNAFDYCSSLTSITIPDNVAGIGASAFAKCTGLTNVTLGAGVTTVGSAAFIYCTNLTSVVIPDSVTNIGSDAFDYCTGLTNITIGAGVASIGNSAFWSCPGLITASIPNNVTNVGNDAFWSCTGLTNITIGSGVTWIGTNAFYWCPSLIGINVDSLNPAYSSINGVLFNKNQTVLVQYPNLPAGSYKIPSGVQSIGNYAFSDSSFLSTVTIPNSVTSIGASAFEDCESLTGLYFSGNAPNADVTAFNYDTNLTVYYTPGSTGWGLAFDGLPTAVWAPQILTGDGNFGLQANQFGFNITGPANISIVVEVCTNLSNPQWQPIQTNTSANGSFYFCDPQATNYTSRFYRIISQ